MSAGPMFHFANPYALLLALLLPPLLWWLLRKRRTALRYPAGDGLAGLPAGRARSRGGEKDAPALDYA